MRMASNCTPKVLQFSNVAKRAPVISASTAKSVKEYCGNNNGKPSRFFSTCSRYPALTPALNAPVKVLLPSTSASVDGYHGRASMSSWLRSSRILFIQGSGNDGDGEDPPSFPSMSRRSSGKELGETSIICQEGDNMDEVPAAVIRSDNSNNKGRKGMQKSYVILPPDEKAAFIDGFNSYNTPQEVLKMLDTIPSQEVTPFVSFSILKKLFELESNFGFRNEGRSWISVSDNNTTTETFARLAIVTRLMETILTSDNIPLLLDTLDLMRRECSNINDHSHGIYDPDNHLDYRNKILQEVLVKVTEGKLDLEQVCRAVVILGKMEIDKGFCFSKDYIDKFWVGIMDHSEDINGENIVES